MTMDPKKTDEMFPRTSGMRTIHSITAGEIVFVLRELEQIPDLSSFLDYGCHLGHLSVEVALRFPIHVVAVDNFCGTRGDALMERTMKELDFRKEHLVESIRGFELQGTVEVLSDIEFWSRRWSVDASFIDSSHLMDDCWQFGAIGEMTKVKVMGHDYGMLPIGTNVKSMLASARYHSLSRYGNSCWSITKIGG